ncbi:MAG: SDR family NAD(P)-dependent oxidoreductase [bacterium]
MSGKLKGKIAIVTGATRGIGLGIARGLGEAGATVIVTGRSTSGKRNRELLPGTVESASRIVEEAGGVGRWFVCDHINEAEVQTLVERVREEFGRLDILVNSAWGGYEDYDPYGFETPFWQLDPDYWDRMVERGLRITWRTSRLAVPLMISSGGGLIVNLSAGDRELYLGNLIYDTTKNAVDRMTFGMATELGDHNISVVSLYPGFTRTERVMSVYQGPLEITESPLYSGRAVVALATDPKVIRKSGKGFKTGELAREYTFVDEDGRQPAPFHIDSPEAEITRPPEQQ